VTGSERCLHLHPQQVEPEINTEIRFVHEDDAIVVLEKPGTLPMRPGGAFRRNTLQFILDAIYRPYRLRPVYILDPDVTGLCVFAKTRQIAGHLKPQFSHHKINATFLARFEGKPTEISFQSELDAGRMATESLGQDAAGNGAVLKVKADFIEIPVIREELRQKGSVTGDHGGLDLHLSQLTITHPLSHEEIRFEAERPGWAR
jgi:23S rRNA-/tRNA-specific pseudouridylate synthase